MKFFILTLIGLVALFFLSSCGVFYTTDFDKQQVKFLKEYSGLYVFDKALRDEMRKLREEEIAQRRLVEKNDPDFYEKMIALEEKYSILSNGYKYKASNGVIPILLLQKDEEKLVRLSGEKKRTFITKTDFTPYFEKIKEYMGEEAFNAYKRCLTLGAYYFLDDGTIVPVSMEVVVSGTVTTYGIYGDEGAGIRFSDTRVMGRGSSNLFYLVDGKFVKSDEKADKGW